MNQSNDLSSKQLIRMRQRDEENRINRRIGARVKERRVELGLSQSAVADYLGLTFQQVQKMERGNNRISAARLEMLCKYLVIPLDYFLDGAPDHRGPTSDEEYLLNAYRQMAEEGRKAIQVLFSLIANHTSL